MSSTRSYAITNGNLDLAAQMRTSLSKVSHMPYLHIIAYVNDAIAAVSPVVGSISALQCNSCNIHNVERSSRHNGIMALRSAGSNYNRKAYGQTIANEMNETMDFVKTSVDTLTLNFKNTYPTYYASYWTSAGSSISVCAIQVSKQP